MLGDRGWRRVGRALEDIERVPDNLSRPNDGEKNKRHLRQPPRGQALDDVAGRNQGMTNTELHHEIYPNDRGTRRHARGAGRRDRRRPRRAAL